MQGRNHGALALPSILANDSIPHRGEIDATIKVGTDDPAQRGEEECQNRGPQAEVDENAKTRPATMPSVE